jgi:hypothetical protein
MADSEGDCGPWYLPHIHNTFSGLADLVLETVWWLI